MTEWSERRRIVAEERRLKEPKRKIQQRIKPKKGQSYTGLGAGFTIKDIVGPFALCQMGNAQVRRIPLDQIRTYTLVRKTQVEERPRQKIFG